MYIVAIVALGLSIHPHVHKAPLLQFLKTGSATQGARDSLAASRLEQRCWYFCFSIKPIQKNEKNINGYFGHIGIYEVK